MMSSFEEHIPVETIRNQICVWLKDRVDQKTYAWLETTSEKFRLDAEDWELFSSFSAVPRHTGKAALALTEDELKQAEMLRDGWDPSHWTVDQMGRALLALSFAERGEEKFAEILEKIFLTSDMGEAVALYQCLPVFPYPGRFKKRAAEGVRSNMTSIFNAVALRNPYPADYFEEGAWNQVVLKALFVESPLYRIHGIDRRANPELAHMLVEYAHERWSAGRIVSPELWRPVGPFIDEINIEDVKKVLEHPDEIQQQAAVLALSDGTFSGAAELLKEHQDLVNSVAGQGVTWEEIGRRFENTHY